MSSSLLLAALLMGLAGSLHCSAMCGPACTALTRRCGGATPASSLLGFHLGRLAGYAAAGALAAAGVGALAGASQAVPVLRPLWSLLHVAALMLGLWLAWTGRQPAWLEDWGRAPALATVRAGWQPLRGPVAAAAAGSAWVALPCGLLQSALLVAALAGSAAGGAAAMTAFALASSLGLLLAGAAWRYAVAAPGALRWAVRLSGVMLAGASAWALGQGLWRQVAAYCVS
jgi:sulfite exporter TauE/SafE